MDRFTEFYKSTFKEKVPREPGVYQVRSEKPFRRLGGTTNVLYIGKAENNLRGRVATFWKKKGRQARPRFERLKRRGYKLRYFYHECSNPSRVEQQLLDNYIRRYLETPPLNHKAK